MNVLLSAGSTLGLPRGAAAPSCVVRAIPEKWGSTPSLNLSLISVGEALTVPPTAGIAFWSSACAKAAGANVVMANQAATPIASFRDITSLLRTTAFRECWGTCRQRRNAARLRRRRYGRLLH